MHFRRLGLPKREREENCQQKSWLYSAFSGAEAADSILTGYGGTRPPTYCARTAQGFRTFGSVFVPKLILAVVLASQEFVAD